MEARLGTRVGLWFSFLLVGTGCTGIEYEEADFQVDFVDRQPENSAQVRLCVAGQLAQTYGARDVEPSYVLFGIRKQGVFETTLEVLDEDGEIVARKAAIMDKNYLLAELDYCEEVVCLPCEAPGGAFLTGDEEWTVAVRFAY